MAENIVHKPHGYSRMNSERPNEKVCDCILRHTVARGSCPKGANIDVLTDRYWPN
jgi:hypothetical protein